MAIQTWQSGTCTVTLDDATGAVTVSGQGPMEDYGVEEQTPWSKSQEAFRSLVIESGVTSIGENAFSDCYSFTGTLRIPSSVTSIGSIAFSYCKGFTGSLIIPDSVTSIGKNAFSGCKGFTGSLSIPAGLTNIESDTFSYCRGFTGSLIIPASVTNIGKSAFSRCSGFTGSLSIPARVTNIAGYAFIGCSGFDKIVNYAKTQEVNPSAFDDLSASAVLYGYPENIFFRAAAKGRWQDIGEIWEILPHIATLTDKQGKDLYPRTKGAAVYLGSGKTVEQALSGVSFWRGTQAEYDALAVKPANTVYCIVGGNVIVT